MITQLDSFLMRTDNDIDYTTIPQETLAALSLESDAYIANSALTEWWVRAKQPATQLNETAWKILETANENDYPLQSTALQIAFEHDRPKALDYMLANMSTMHPQLLNTMVELLMYDSDFRYEMVLASMMMQKISGREEEMGDYLDPDSIMDFTQLMSKSITKLSSLPQS
ncbi:MAG: hypothetical protein AAF639_40725 [Chloroflexota bacterium]